MKIELLSSTKNQDINISKNAFSKDFNEALVHQAVVSFLAGSRQGSSKQKTRSEVRGGGKKPYRQKGTGRARAGTTRGPLWVGGGMAFATVNRNYKKKINKKAYKKAMQSIFSALIEEKRIIAIESIKIDSPRTKLGVEVLKSLELESALIIVSELDENLNLSLRNIPHVKVISVENVHPINLLSHQSIVIDQEALNKLEGMFS